MSNVRDPNFWRRFSVAVHQDDAAKEEMAKRPELKHSYVKSLSSSTPSITPSSPVALQPFSPTSTAPMYSPSHSISAPTTPKTPTTPSTPKRQPSRLTKTNPGAPPRKSPRRPSLAYNPFTRHTNDSRLTLGLSGRPQSRFKFWTSVEANPSNRQSWLESQQKKRRQRTWMCWAFWICFAAIVAGIVVAVLLLKAKNII